MAQYKGGVHSIGGVKTLKVEKSEKGSRGSGRGGMMPFHRRSPLAEEGAWAVEVAGPLSRFVLLLRHMK
jgi:hypothetical protein